jgi:hypothetical protein
LYKFCQLGVLFQFITVSTASIILSFPGSAAAGAQVHADGFAALKNASPEALLQPANLQVALDGSSDSGSSWFTLGVFSYAVSNVKVSAVQTDLTGLPLFGEASSGIYQIVADLTTPTIPPLPGPDGRLQLRMGRKNSTQWVIGDATVNGKIHTIMCTVAADIAPLPPPPIVGAPTDPYAPPYTSGDIGVPVIGIPVVETAVPAIEIPVGEPAVPVIGIPVGDTGSNYGPPPVAPPASYDGGHSRWPAGGGRGGRSGRGWRGR